MFTSVAVCCRVRQRVAVKCVAVKRVAVKRVAVKCVAVKRVAVKRVAVKCVAVETHLAPGLASISVAVCCSVW